MEQKVSHLSQYFLALHDESVGPAHDEEVSRAVGG